MPTKPRRMILRDILPAYGITTIQALARQTDMSRQQAWNLWHGKAGVGKAMMKRLHEHLGIPLDALILVEQPTPPKPRGRPRTSREGDGEP
jgi:transcriptional regulator with XRE-family HTH domain